MSDRIGPDDPGYDPDVDDLECDECGRGFDDRREMHAHRRRAHGAFE